MSVDPADDAENERSFVREMSDSAHAILAAREPYESAIGLWSSMFSQLGSGRETSFTGRAWHMWGFLTDAVDGPAPYRRGLSESEIDGLIRRAAQEWLDIPKSRDEIARYFDRWDGWPDSIEADR